MAMRWLFVAGLSKLPRNFLNQTAIAYGKTDSPSLPLILKKMLAAALVLCSLGTVASSFHHTRSKHTTLPQNVLWLPLGDSITFGCTGPTIQDCHSDSAGYRIPLALALSQAPLGSPDLVGFNITTMGTDTTGPSFVPSAWTHHCGFPGWTIPMIDNFLPKAFASSKQSPDLITMCVLRYYFL